MAKFLIAKLASAAALVSTSIMLSGCQTSAGKPVVCDSGFEALNGRCYKVAGKTAQTRGSEHGNSSAY